MPAASESKPAPRKLGRIEGLFGVSLGVYLILLFTAAGSVWTTIAEAAAIFFGAWLIVRVFRTGLRQAIWRLRNRLLVTYLFIAVVPILLIATLAMIVAYALTSQIAVHLVTSELERRIAVLQSAGANLERTPPAARGDAMRGMAALYSERYPGIEFLLRESGKTVRYPADSRLEAPPEAWKSTSGVVRKDGRFYLWSHTEMATGEITILAPMTSEFLARLVPNLGLVYFGTQIGDLAATTSRSARKKAASEQVTGGLGHIPPAANRLDFVAPWFSYFPSAVWEQPNTTADSVVAVVSRPSAVLATFFSRKADWVQSILPTLLAIVTGVFILVEIVSLFIGVSMTRTITGAVHHLYEGTRRVTHGDFSHRIEVEGDDQLADLSRSFNRMTENLERLLIVAKEKERLESEIEIAREVQNQLYPKTVPLSPALKMTAVCKPARMVSGDYYDYESLLENKVALAIGDVAGKGISAALLMATLQSSMRAQLRSSLEAAAVATGGTTAPPPLSTSLLVSRLNQQLYATTSPEKYATFYFGVFDEATGWLTYTNAGHLPPLLVSRGEISRLDVNGIVVGAFSRAQYEESRVEMRPGDLLVCFTDGISEPENEYGEMFGEERLAELVLKNAHKDNGQIIETVIDAVEQWSAGGEQQDDMTILVARRQ